MQQLISLQKLHAKPLMDNNAILLQNGGNLNTVHSLTTFNFKDLSMKCPKMAGFFQLKQF
jgi:hypothetical protein